MTYQTEFNSLKKAIKYLFSSKERKKQKKESNEQSDLNKGKVVIDIKREDYSKEN